MTDENDKLFVIFYMPNRPPVRMTRAEFEQLWAGVINEPERAGNPMEDTHGNR